MTEKHLHATHPDVVKRLKRASGHLLNVISMIEDGRACGEVAQQLHAVERAIGAAKKVVIHDHLDHCLDDVVGATPAEMRSSIAEFKDITKYL
nr:metal-sensing transcriptional repressor [uncultured Albidiferax sp.]